MENINNHHKSVLGPLKSYNIYPTIVLFMMSPQNKPYLFFMKEIGYVYHST